MSAIANAKYVRLTTFTKDGRRKHTPVWIAPLAGGKVGFTTGAGSWKIKRMRNTPNVELAISDMRGNVEDDAVTATGTAEIVTDADFQPVHAAIKAKYGFQLTLITVAGKIGKLFGKKRGASNCGVVITLD